ncbi:SIMPL domain-containing protein [Streptomyces bobili]|uniref:SIMPL domain-containing protein n=1 Tax=Streptomyces bobili TaxID=67280 RepID=UPI0033ADA656
MADTPPTAPGHPGQGRDGPARRRPPPGRGRSGHPCRERLRESRPRPHGRRLPAQGLSGRPDLLGDDREVGRTGAVLQTVTDAAGEAGRVDSVNSGVSDPAPLPARARLAAHEDAHTKALQYARLSGHRLEPPGLPRPGRDRLSAPGPPGRRRGIGRCPRGAGRHPRDGDGRVRARLSGSANPAEPYPNPTGVGLSAPGRSTSMLPARVPGPAPPPPIAAHGPGTPHRRRT